MMSDIKERALLKTDLSDLTLAIYQGPLTPGVEIVTL